MRSTRRGKTLRGAQATRARRARRKDPPVTLSLRLPASVAAALKRRAKSEERSANKTIVWLLRKELAEEINALDNEEKERAVAAAAEDVDWSNV